MGIITRHVPVQCVVLVRQPVVAVTVCTLNCATIAASAQHIGNASAQLCYADHMTTDTTCSERTQTLVTVVSS
eukprot:18593-Heterococcus_DN1.PRE.1